MGLFVRHVHSLLHSGVKNRAAQRVRNDVLGVPFAPGVVLRSERRSKHRRGYCPIVGYFLFGVYYIISYLPMPKASFVRCTLCAEGKTDVQDSQEGDGTGASR